MNNNLNQIRFNISQNEATLFVKSCDNHLLIVSINVDDMLIIGSQLGMIKKIQGWSAKNVLDD